MKCLISVFVKGALFAVLPMAMASAAGTGENVVTLAEARRWAIDNHPQGALNRKRMEAVSAQVEQAGARPNPVISAEVENLAGSGPFSGIDGMEITIGITHTLESAEKRNRRTRLAQSELGIIEQEWLRQQAAVETAVTTAYAAVLLRQEQAALKEEALHLAASRLEETRRLIAAARMSMVDQLNADMQHRAAQLDLRRTQAMLEAARSRLAAHWGSFHPQSFSVAGELTVEPVPPWETLVKMAKDSWQLSGFEAMKQQRQASFDLEVAESRIDVELFGGARYFNEADGDAALVLGVDVPWQVFNRNEGNIRAARAVLSRLDNEKAVLEREILTRLQEVFNDMSAAREEMRFIEETMLPGNLHLVQEARRARDAGQLGTMDVLDTQQALLDTRLALWEAKSRYFRAWQLMESQTRPTGSHHNAQINFSEK